jgi:hypothetical protein
LAFHFFSHWNSININDLRPKSETPTRPGMTLTKYFQTEVIMTTPSDTAAAPRGWPWFIIGIVLVLLGFVLTFVQFNVLSRLTTPWQMPILATLGVICMLLSVLQRGGWGRIAGFLLFAFVSGALWFMLLYGMNTPPYTGPATPRNPVPTMTAKLADGRPFSNADLADGKPSVMLFYRGLW